MMTRSIERPDSPAVNHACSRPAIDNPAFQDETEPMAGAFHQPMAADPITDAGNDLGRKLPGRGDHESIPHDA